MDVCVCLWGLDGSGGRSWLDGRRWVCWIFVLARWVGRCGIVGGCVGDLRVVLRGSKVVCLDASRVA